ncbi:hypothetical protein RN346_10590 [Halomonas sp. PAMB 3232]|uniref:hypothetical protein n=1 Tax=Halomonas sp. PAMB 3232 TaxID=3075221 RepID=UPI00289A924B|nr:hypothetical protein [Halomonas sp. PAMB 3232]WNL37759.1 hypothetical protein RN346_10590 [Halomonas sp. PAMB 3232]
MMPTAFKRLHLGHPAHLIVGLTLWSIWFVAVYGGLSVACAVAPPAPDQGSLTGLNLGLGLVSVATTVLLFWLAWAGWKVGRELTGRPRFNALVSAGLYFFSAFGVVFTGMPIIGVPPCL